MPTYPQGTPYIYQVTMRFTHPDGTPGILRHRYIHRKAVDRRIEQNRQYLAKWGHIETGLQVERVPRYAQP